MHLQVLHGAAIGLITSHAGQFALRTVDHPVQALVQVPDQDGARDQREHAHDGELFRVAQRD
jgi:hypothetical protein